MYPSATADSIRNLRAKVKSARKTLREAAQKARQAEAESKILENALKVDYVIVNRQDLKGSDIKAREHEVSALIDQNPRMRQARHSSEEARRAREEAEDNLEDLCDELDSEVRIFEQEHRDSYLERMLSGFADNSSLSRNPDNEKPRVRTKPESVSLPEIPLAQKVASGVRPAPAPKSFLEDL